MDLDAMDLIDSLFDLYLGLFDDLHKTNKWDAFICIRENLGSWGFMHDTDGFGIDPHCINSISGFIKEQMEQMVRRRQRDSRMAAHGL